MNKFELVGQCLSLFGPLEKKRDLQNQNARGWSNFFIQSNFPLGFWELFNGVVVYFFNLKLILKSSQNVNK